MHGEHVCVSVCTKRACVCKGVHKGCVHVHTERVCAMCACTLSMDVHAQGVCVCANVGVQEEHTRVCTMCVQERCTRVGVQPQGAPCKRVAAQGVHTKRVHACERVCKATHV